MRVIIASSEESNLRKINFVENWFLQSRSSNYSDKSRSLNFNSSDGQVVRVSASGAVDSGLIPSRVKPMALKMIFTSFPAQRSALKGQCGEQASKFTCYAIRKGT